MRSTFILLLLVWAFNTNAQHTERSSANKEIVKKFLNGFNDPSQIQASLDLLADDYKFQNPIVKLQSKTEFIALAQEIGAVINEIELLNITENGDWVATFYHFKSSVPGLETNTASEWFRLENGIIKESHLVYDTFGWRKFYADMKE